MWHVCLWTGYVVLQKWVKMKSTRVGSAVGVSHFDTHWFKTSQQ